MNLHEYQAKDLLAKYGINVVSGILATTVDEARAAFNKLGGQCAVIKAQVHAGGRGKSGGVKVVKSEHDTIKVAEALLGKHLVTYQTDSHGQVVNSLYICEDIYPVQREMYLGAVIDRSKSRITFMASTEGGVEIEQVAKQTPDKIFKLTIDPSIGLMPCHSREIGFSLSLNSNQVDQLVKLLLGVYAAFIENDFALFEINPLVINQNGDLVCVDAKINLDGNALYRHPNLLALRDKSQENPRELRASEFDLNYISLDGNIGCMVNGAGLAMATMDIIKLYGGTPANFLDVGGSATKERVVEAFKIILDDENVQAVLINIFGGIVRCDMIAEAIIEAVKTVQVKIPVVVRLEGNNADIGIKLLDNCGLTIISADGLANAASKVVNTLKG